MKKGFAEGCSHKFSSPYPQVVWQVALMWSMLPREIKNFTDRISDLFTDISEDEYSSLSTTIVSG